MAPQDSYEPPSSKTGEGEHATNMSQLVQRTMTSILTPLNERVLELEEWCQAQEKSIAELAERSQVAAGRLDGHDQKVAGLGADLARSNEDVKLAHEGLQEAAERHAALENDHDVTRALANRTEAMHKNTAASLGDLQRMQEGLDSQVRQLQLALSETNIAHLNINDRVSELRNRYEGLNDRHLDLVKSVQDLKQADENTRQALKRFTATFDKQRKDDQRSFSQLDDRAKNLEAALIEAQHQSETGQKQGKATKAEVERLKQHLEALVGQQSGAQNGLQNSSAVGPNDWQGRIGKIEDSLARVSKLTSTDKNQSLNVVQAVSDAMHKSTQDLAKVMGDIESLDKVVKNHDNRIMKLEHTGTELAANQQKMREQADRAEQDLRGQIAAVQRDANSKSDNHSLELAKTNAVLQQTNQRAEAHAGALQSLHSDLSSTNGMVSKLGHSVDLAHEYCQGITKGFHDTHKRVQSGQDGMLPPKSGGSRRLPVIVPSSPRPGAGSPF